MFAWCLTVGCILFALKWPGTLQSQGLSLTSAYPQILAHAMPVVLWVATFLKQWMNELNKLSLQSILKSIHCLLVLIALSLLTLSGNLLPVLIFAFSSCCSYCFSKYRYHRFLSVILILSFSNRQCMSWFVFCMILVKINIFLHMYWPFVLLLLWFVCFFLLLSFIWVYFCFFLVIFKISLRLKVAAFVCFLTH